MNDFTPFWFIDEETKEITYQDSCGDFMIPTKEQLVEILNNNEKQITGYLLMVKQQEKIIKKFQEDLERKEDLKPQEEENKPPCNILRFPTQPKDKRTNK